MKPFYKHAVIHWTKETTSCKQVAKEQTVPSLYRARHLAPDKLSKVTFSEFDNLAQNEQAPYVGEGRREETRQLRQHENSMQLYD